MGKNFVPGLTLLGYKEKRGRGVKKAFGDFVVEIPRICLYPSKPEKGFHRPARHLPARASAAYR
jgi:hypothetical protein